LGQYLIPIPVLGAVVGGIVGGILGGFLDKIFGKNKDPRIGAGGFDIEPGDTRFFDTALGGVFVGDTRGGLDDFVAEFGQGIEEFDAVIAGFLDADSIGKISDRLKVWSQELNGDAITLEQLLASRFTAIMSTFTDEIRAFVNRSADLEGQVSRLQIAVTAQNIMVEMPELFGDATLTDFLDIVEGFRIGAEDLTQTFQRVLTIFNQIVAVQTALKDFAGSDLAGDFQALLDLQNLTLTDALAGLNAGLMDAITNFDGSIESLTEIGLIVSSIREGELKLLSQIDDIQKGISSSLDKLKSDILGLTEIPKTGEQIFTEAVALRGQITLAETPEEIARLTQEYAGRNAGRNSPADPRVRGVDPVHLTGRTGVESGRDSGAD
jgi:hypothetical protein